MEQIDHGRLDGTPEQALTGEIDEPIAYAYAFKTDQPGVTHIVMVTIEKCTQSFAAHFVAACAQRPDFGL